MLIANRAQKIATEYQPIRCFTQVAIVVRHQDGTLGLEALTHCSRVGLARQSRFRLEIKCVRDVKNITFLHYSTVMSSK